MIAMHTGPVGSAMTEPRIVAIFDLGSNSCRLMIVKVAGQNAACTVLNEVKQMVRLGEGVALSGRLSPEAMARTRTALEAMADMCRVYGVQDMVACATAAAREASNATAFLHSIHEQTGIPFTIISGHEEARLIYLGVVSGLEYSDRRRLFIDIGGGSTELVVGSSQEYFSLDSIHAGCVRLTNKYLAGNSGPVSAEAYRELQDAIRVIAMHPLQRVRESKPVEAVGSSGTIQNLASMAAMLRCSDEGEREEYARILRYADLGALAKTICERSMADRAKIPGINPRRGDVIVAGAAVIQTLMEELSLSEVQVSNRSLKDGVLMDYLLRTRPDVFPQGMPTREQSVLRLGRQCHFEEGHSLHVGHLALELYDSFCDMGWRTPDMLERELLWYACLLHDVGIFISLENHHSHSWYLIRHKELLGFNNSEVEMLAATAYFHRKGYTGSESGVLDRLDSAQKKMVRAMSFFLTLAERLDKTHCRLVRHARFLVGRKGGMPVLELTVAGDCHMEMQALDRCRKLLRRAFPGDITIAARRPQGQILS